MAELRLLDNEEIPTRRISVGYNQRYNKPIITHDIDIFQYLSLYGRISSIYLQQANNNSKCIAIDYAHSASVTALVAKGKRIINGIMLELAPVYSFRPTIAHHFVDSTEKTTKTETENTDPAPDHDSSSNIMNKLNDDCLMEIFERTSLRDLCVIANTCTRFNEIVKKVFVARFTNIDVVWLKKDEQPNVPIPMVLIASLFRNFGAYIKSVTINLNDIGKGRNDRVLSLISKYCTAENCALSGLKISNFQFQLNLMDGFRPIFDRLTHLSTSGMDGTNLKRLLSMCKNLIHLQLEAIDFGRTHKQKFKQLEDIELICVSGLSNLKLKELISLNQKIKRLIICDPFNQLSSVAYKSISNLPLLEHIEIEPAIPTPEKEAEKNILALAQLKRLKVFRLNCVATPINELLNSFAEEKCSIHDLSLKGLLMDSKNTKSISKMANIRTLRLLDTPGSDIGHFMQTIKKMPYLQHLVCGGGSCHLSMENVTELIEATPNLSKFCLIKHKNMVIDLDDYNKMLSLIKERDNSIGLNIKILGMELNMVVPEHIVEQNLQWLNIKLKNIDIDIEDSEEEEEEAEQPFEDEDEDEDEDDINNHVIEMIMMHDWFVNRIQQLADEID